MSQILRFTTNVPEEVTLRSISGKRVEGRYGEQMLYNLFDDRVMYVPLIVAQRIRELDIAEGEAFEICKAEAREGNRKWIEWKVRKYDPPQQPPTSPNGSAAAATAPSNGQEQENRSTNGNGNGNGHRSGSNGNAQKQYQTAPDGTILPAPITGKGVTVMEVAMNAAAEVAQRVESRASLRDYQLHFTSEDIRAIGLTMFIQAGRDGGVRWES